mmetsp:Transcript_137218/g.249456  ORF Transcript_137218/g.249456 Transcript_137218/m.249456 type:complete len:1193 (+) Transcript_137218:82-3660(+)
MPSCLLLFGVLTTACIWSSSQGHYMRREKKVGDSEQQEVSEGRTSGLSHTLIQRLGGLARTRSALQAAYALDETSQSALAAKLNTALHAMTRDERKKVEHIVEAYSKRVFGDEEDNKEPLVDEKQEDRTARVMKEMEEVFPQYRFDRTNINTVQLPSPALVEREAESPASFAAYARVNSSTNSSTNSSVNVSGEDAQPFKTTQEYKEWVPRFLAAGLNHGVQSLNENVLNEVIKNREQKEWLDARLKEVEASKAQYMAQFAAVESFLEDIDRNEHRIVNGFEEKPITIKDRLMWLRNRTLQGRLFNLRQQLQQAKEGLPVDPEEELLKKNKTYRHLRMREHEAEVKHDKETVYQGGGAVDSGFWAESRPEEERVDPMNMKVYHWQNFKLLHLGSEPGYKVESDWKNLPLAPRRIRKIQIRENHKLVKTVLMDENYNELHYVRDQYGGWFQGRESPSADEVEALHKPYYHRQQVLQKRWGPLNEAIQLYPDNHDIIEEKKKVFLNFTRTKVEREHAKELLELQKIGMKKTANVTRRTGKTSIIVRRYFEENWFGCNAIVENVTVRNLKERIERETDIPWEAQRLMKKGEEMDDDLLLNEYCEGSDECKLSLGDRGSRAHAVGDIRRGKGPMKSLLELRPRLMRPIHRVKRAQEQWVPLDSVSRLTAKERENVIPMHAIEDVGYNRKNHPFASFTQEGSNASTNESAEAASYSGARARILEDGSLMITRKSKHNVPLVGPDGKRRKRRKMHNNPEHFTESNDVDDDEDIPDYWKLPNWIPAQQWQWNKYQAWLQREAKRKRISEALKLSKMHNSSARVLSPNIKTDEDRAEELDRLEEEKKQRNLFADQSKPSYESGSFDGDLSVAGNGSVIKLQSEAWYYRQASGQWKMGWKREAKSNQSLDGNDGFSSNILDTGIALTDLVTSQEIWQEKAPEPKKYEHVIGRDPGLSLEEQNLTAADRRKRRIQEHEEAYMSTYIPDPEGWDFRNFSRNFDLLEHQSMDSNASKRQQKVALARQKRMEAKKKKEQMLLEKAKKPEEGQEEIKDPPEPTRRTDGFTSDEQKEYHAHPSLKTWLKHQKAINSRGMKVKLKDIFGNNVSKLSTTGPHTRSIYQLTSTPEPSLLDGESRNNIDTKTKKKALELSQRQEEERQRMERREDEELEYALREAESSRMYEESHKAGNEVASVPAAHTNI